MKVEALLQQRQQKDEFIKSEQSPFPQPMREAFEGLNYFPPSEKYYFEIHIEEDEAKPAIDVDKTDGQVLTVKRFGIASFKVEDEPVTVVILDHQGDLAVIFKDLTSGEDTYSGGRSMPVTPTDSGTYILDFNQAANPMCVYMSGYSCPIPIPENHLPVAIHAGEKLPVGKWVMMA